ncbi:MAG: SGNH/GDSL hydrolase family protein, partial [Microcystaceae cyanobacterium]
MSNSKKKEIIGNIILSLGGVAFGLIIMEMGLRIMGISYPSFYQVDRDRGHALIPNYSAQWTHEGNGYVAINKDGLRDHDHELTKSPETYRIAVIGDSFSEAIQVNAEDTFWAAIERDLAKCPRFQNKKVEVINFGVGDYGTAQELMTIKNQVWKYQPDLVLLAIFTGNDLVNNSKALSQSDRFAPFLVEKNGKFEMDFSFRETETYRRRASGIRQIGFYLINNFRVLQVINEAKRALTTRQTLVGKAIESDQKEQVSSLIPALDFDVNLYREPQTENWRSAWT